MPRIARIVIPDVLYHVTQRGNNRQDVFFTDDDRRAYLDVLGEQSERFGLDLLGHLGRRLRPHPIGRPVGWRKAT
jgi:putative transposase